MCVYCVCILCMCYVEERMVFVCPEAAELDGLSI